MADFATNDHYARPDTTGTVPRGFDNSGSSDASEARARYSAEAGKGLSMVRTRAMDRTHVPAGWWCVLAVSVVGFAVTYTDIRSVTGLLAYEDFNPSLARGVVCALGLTAAFGGFAFLMVKRPAVWIRLHLVVAGVALLWGGGCLLAGLRFIQWLLPYRITTSIWQSGQWLGLAIFPLFLTAVLLLPLVVLPWLLPPHVPKAGMVRLATTMLCIGAFFPFEMALFGASVEEILWLSPFWLFMIAGVLLFPMMLGLMIVRPGLRPPSVARSVAGLLGAAVAWAVIFSGGGMAVGSYGLWLMLGPVALVSYIFFVRARDALFPVEMSTLWRFVRSGGITEAEYGFLVDDDLYGEFVSRARSRAAKSEAAEYLLAARGLAMTPVELVKDSTESQRRSVEYLGMRLVQARAALRGKDVGLHTRRPVPSKYWHSS